MFKINNLNMIYDIDSEEKTYALNNVNLTIKDKGLVGIVGPSGSGKSTLMYTMSTLKKPTEGSVIYNGTNIVNINNKEKEYIRRSEFGFIFQKHYLISYMTILDNIIVTSTDPRNEAREKAKKLLARLGLKEKEFYKRPTKLSGGQCQRAAIARAMINNPKVIFADEPTAALDHKNAHNVMQILKEYSKDHLVIVVTHDRSVLTDVDMLVEMWDGKLSNLNSTDVGEVSKYA